MSGIVGSRHCQSDDKIGNSNFDNQRQGQEDKFCRAAGDLWRHRRPFYGNEFFERFRNFVLDQENDFQALSGSEIKKKSNCRLRQELSTRHSFIDSFP